jgi:hypothetical protein
VSPAAGKVGADDFIAAGRGPDLAEQPRVPLGTVRPLELRALLAQTYPEPDAIIGGGLLPRQALAVTGGPPKRGKSLLTVQKALARAAGLPWLGFPTTPGITLVLQAEIPERELQARVRIMERALSDRIPDGQIYFVTHRGLRLDRRGDLRVVRTLIETLKPDLVQIDPLARFFSGEENSTRDMSRLVSSLDELIEEYHVAIELVHHTAKPSNDDPRAGGFRLRGSTALFAAADSVQILDKTRDGAFQLSFELRHGAEPQPIRLQRNDALWFEPTGAPDELVEVAGIVERLPLRYTKLLAAIQADLGVSKRTAETLVARARRAGLIVADKALYRTTANYRTAAAAVEISPDA